MVLGLSLGQRLTLLLMVLAIVEVGIASTVEQWLRHPLHDERITDSNPSAATFVFRFTTEPKPPLA